MPSPWSSPKDPAYPGHIPPEFRDGSPFYPTGYFGDPIPLEYPDLHDPVPLGREHAPSPPLGTQHVSWVDDAPQPPPPSPIQEAGEGPEDDEPLPLPYATVLKYDVVLPLALLTLNFAVYVLYSFLVGLVFLAIEQQPNEVLITAQYNEFLAQNFTQWQTDYLQRTFGLGLPYNRSTRQWDYLSSQYYVITYSSTIGYGDFVPCTASGKFLTFFFGIIGLPLMGFLFVKAGSHFVRFAVTALLLGLSLCMGLKFRTGSEGEKAVRQLAQIEREVTLADLHDMLGALEGGAEVRWLDVCLLMEVADVNQSGTLDRHEIEKALRHWAKKTAAAEIRSNPLMLLYVFFLLQSWLAFSAWIFSLLEGYQWSTGWWFGYITLTTIGYGDEVATNTKSRLYWILFVFLGVGLMSWLVLALAERLVGVTRRVVHDGLRFSYRYQLLWEPRRWERFLRRWASLWLPLTVLVGYALLGDVMFVAYEQVPSQARAQLATAVATNSSLTAGQREYLAAHLKPPTVWSFTQAFMFSMVSITTIGYGNSVPTTTAGKSLLIVYTFFGIGLVAYFLGQLANVFTEGLIWLIAALTRPFGNEYVILREADFEECATRLFEGAHTTGHSHTTKRATTDNLAQSFQTMRQDELQAALPDAGAPEDRLSQEGLVGVARWLARKRRQMIMVNFASNLAALFLLSLTFAGVYVGLEGWNYADSLWFCYVTLATIGFGDFVPTTEASAVFTVFVVLVNMGFFANCLTMAGPLFQALTITARNAWHRRRQVNRQKAA